MNTVKAILMWPLSLALALAIFPWMIVMAIKLALWPQLLTEYETRHILGVKDEIKDATALSTVADFMGVGAIALFTPLWMSVWLWMAMVVSYLFMLLVRNLALDEKSDREIP